MSMFDDILNNVGEPYKGAGKGFVYGTHEVVIGSVESVEKKTRGNDKAPVLEVVVFDEKDEERKATCTLYFHTEGGAKMAVTKVLGILVHNAGEDKKDTIRNLGKKLFGSIDSAEAARDITYKLMNEKMIGKKAYLFADPRGKYKSTSYGDLWHYAYEDPNADDRAEEMLKSGEAVTGEAADDIPEFGDI